MDPHETILKDIKNAVLSVDRNADVLLFGSRARVILKKIGIGMC